MEPEWETVYVCLNANEDVPVLEMKVHQEPLFYIVDCFIIILFSDSTHLKTLQVMLRSFIMELITQILPPSCIIW